MNLKKLLIGAAAGTLILASSAFPAFAKVERVVEPIQ
jgi:hypothetical protein